MCKIQDPRRTTQDGRSLIDHNHHGTEPGGNLPSTASHQLPHPRVIISHQGESSRTKPSLAKPVLPTAHRLLSHVSSIRPSPHPSPILIQSITHCGWGTDGLDPPRLPQGGTHRQPALPSWAPSCCHAAAYSSHTTPTAQDAGGNKATGLLMLGEGAKRNERSPPRIFSHGWPQIRRHLLLPVRTTDQPSTPGRLGKPSASSIPSSIYFLLRAVALSASPANPDPR